MKTRCAWANTQDIFIPYHDEEWGVPVHDDRLLFEMLNLEGAQAGLSWLVILRKRAAYKKAFDNFNAKKIVKYDAKKRASLLKNEGIVRHKLKIAAVIENAKIFLKVQKEFGSFDHYVWSFVDGKPTRGGKLQESRSECVAFSKDLKQRGFRFLGPTTCYAFMQAVGMVNDHTANCFKAPKKIK
jgi:DNA-3-methyladenine glycosylase I